MTRDYPSDGSIPTKISTLRTKLVVLQELLLTVAGADNPKRPG